MLQIFTHSTGNCLGIVGNLDFMIIRGVPSHIWSKSLHFCGYLECPNINLKFFLAHGDMLTT